MRGNNHTHPCRSCGTSAACGGELLQNYDGWPETICRIYHLDCYWFLCAACDETAQQQAEHDLREQEAGDANGNSNA